MSSGYGFSLLNALGKREEIEPLDDSREKDLPEVPKGRVAQVDTKACVLHLRHHGYATPLKYPRLQNEVITQFLARRKPHLLQNAEKYGYDSWDEWLSLTARDQDYNAQYSQLIPNDNYESDKLLEEMTQLRMYYGDAIVRDASKFEIHAGGYLSMPFGESEFTDSDMNEVGRLLDEYGGNGILLPCVPSYTRKMKMRHARARTQG